MDKSQLLYNATSEFESNKDILETKRHYTAETLDNKYIHFKNKRVILPIKDISESVAADICIVNNETLEKYIVEPNSYNLETFPSENYTPIGVVVVPASHTDDGTARVISLACMDYNNPDIGNTSGHVLMAWGGYGSDVPNIDYKTQVPWIGTAASELTEAQTLQGWTASTLAEFSSDYYNNEYPNPYDEGTCFGRSYRCAPSPYLTGGAKNEIYHSTENTGNVYADMDGKGNTQKILAVDNGVSTSWQTASTITNAGTTSTIHPSAQCCWRYHTVGTNQGDWYLPSAGEFGYLSARWKTINNSITVIRDSGAVHALALPVGSGWWSSTEHSSNNAVDFSLSTNYAYLPNSHKNTYYVVRAFLAV